MVVQAGIEVGSIGARSSENDCTIVGRCASTAASAADASCVTTWSRSSIRVVGGSVEAASDGTVIRARTRVAVTDRAGDIASRSEDLLKLKKLIVGIELTKSFVDRVDLLDEEVDALTSDGGAGEGSDGGNEDDAVEFVVESLPVSSGSGESTLGSKSECAGLCVADDGGDESSVVKNDSGILGVGNLDLSVGGVV